MEGKLKYPVITISREYAAYGRTIAAGLSSRLGIPFYGKDFVKETAKQSGYSEEVIVREGEDMSPASKFMNSLLNNANAYSSSYDGIYKAQKEVILNLAQKPCIIVGRCADHILTRRAFRHSKSSCTQTRNTAWNAPQSWKAVPILRNSKRFLSKKTRSVRPITSSTQVTRWVCTRTIPSVWIPAHWAWKTALTFSALC